MSPAPPELPGSLPGDWKFDPVNSEIRFSARYLGVSRIHGRFGDVTGTIVTGDILEQSSVAALIPAASVGTGFTPWDRFLRSEAVLDAA